MRAHGEVLRRLVDEEQEAAGDALAPADDGAVRAHLRFAALALEADGGLEPAGLAAALPGWFAAERDRYEAHLRTGEGAIALEEHLRFGTLPGADPSLDEGLRRRLRIGGWVRLFLLCVEDRLGPASDGLADRVGAVLSERGRELAQLILALDSRAKSAARAAAGGAPDAATLDEIGQAAVVQGHVRLMIEVLAETLAERE